MTYNKALDSYNQINMDVNDPLKLILMLYEGAFRFVNFAKKAILDGDLEKKVKYIIKASNIFVELINSLDYEKGGDIAYYLSGLYTHQLKLLAKANVENETKYLDEVINVIRELREAWKEETGVN
jgi:flagellar protein FliS